MIVALSGTPGTGKTRIAEEFDRDRFEILSMNHLTGEYRTGRDEERGTTEVDIESLVEDIAEGRIQLPGDPERTTVIEGHLSHLLPVDMIIVLRTSTRVLEKRLREREYSDGKVRENMEAEALGVISMEAIETGHPLYEVDTTDRTPAQGAGDCVSIITSRPPPVRGPDELIDYSEEILEWY
jgi:adenylate kinase